MNMTLDDIFTSWASLISPHFPFCDQHQTVAHIFFLANISFSTLCFCIIIVVVVFIIFRSVWENKMKRGKCSSMSSCLLFLIACDWPHWLRALKREGREPFVARLYVRVCSSAGSGRNARAERSELWQTSSTTDVDGTRRTCYIYWLLTEAAASVWWWFSGLSRTVLFQRGSEKVWRNALSVPGQPAVYLQHPAC